MSFSEKYGDVLAEARRDHVGWLEIQRPPNNFFDHALITDLVRGLDALGDAGCRAVVLASAGKHFCAGANFSDKTAAQGNAAAAADKERTNPLYVAATALFRRRLPIVAAVRGAAIGGGLGVAMAADFRIGGPSTRLAANFVQLGIHPGFGLTVTLPRIIGHQHTADLLLSGRRVKGEEAHAMGLLDRYVADDQIQQVASALATTLAANAPLAVQSTRDTLREGLAERVRLATDREYLEQRWHQQTDDHAEGVAAVAARRPGQFRAR